MTKDLSQVYDLQLKLKNEQTNTDQTQAKLKYGVIFLKSQNASKDLFLN